MPEWGGHWIVDAGLAAFCAMFALYTNRRWQQDDQENDRYNRRHEKTEDRVSLLEKSMTDISRWLTQIELDRTRLEAEKLARLDRIERGQQTIQSKLDRFSGRMETTRFGDE